MSLNTTVSYSQVVVSGANRYKYFKRPIMPRVSPMPPQVLLAPTTTENPLIPINSYVEPSVKDVEVQTLFRDSEAQTVPYTPNFSIIEGENPEVLLLKKLTYENGLPLGKKEIEMIEYSRAKREMEINLPPFTDEASLLLRKKLMEQQEMREFRLRETEIDICRENKLIELEQALIDREESNEFMTSQRLEGVRQLRMEEREKIMQKIRNKRIKALRRLAHQRNISDPILSDGTGRDIISDYFDKGSQVYAPVQRDGRGNAQIFSRYDVASRTLPLDNIGNILSLEYTIPKRFLDFGGAENNDSNFPAQLSKTAPVGSAINMRGAAGRGRAAEPRLTSAAARTLRNTKRDIEEMHHILNQRKHMMIQHGSSPSLLTSTDVENSGGMSLSRTAAVLPNNKLTKRMKNRPLTPDFTVDRISSLQTEGTVLLPDYDEDIRPEYQDDLEFQSAVILLQRLIRGRSVQNIMFEGKYRRAELISELKAAEDARFLHLESDNVKIDLELQIERETQLRDSSMDAILGGTASHLIHTLSVEKSRAELVFNLQSSAFQILLQRRNLECCEARRRQDGGLQYPKKNNC